jgi:aspartyl-tRNA(Asn)/glutamyl-tRNA(Gln) amidotransferase subunit A
MPTTAGSLTDVTDIIGPEGSFVKNLKRCGAVILGKATCIEFAFGTLGINRRRTPWNPWDPKVQRVVGGSSSGSAVAVAAGLCAFAIGTDTGASVRLPAGLCGVFGLRTNPQLWPTDGVFPLVADMDSIGPLTKSAADAAIVFGALTGQPAPTAAPIGGLRLGKPEFYYYANLDANVAKCMDAALAALAKAGAEIVPIEVPEAAEREKYFPLALPAYVLGVLGRERYLRIRDQMDPIVSARCASGMEIKAAEFIQAERRRYELWKIAERRMEGFDAWIVPTMAIVAPPVADFADLKRGMQLTLAITQTMQPGSMFGQCGTSNPVNMYGSELPVGLHVVCRPHDVAKALSIGLAVESLTGLPPVPDVSAFLS